MTLPAELSLRIAGAQDLPAIARLRTSVGWSVHDWALRIAVEPPRARCVVAVDRDEIVAVGSGIAYGPLGFVGNMVVDAAHRRRGLGSAILDAVTEFLVGAGCTRLELYATADGRLLYARHGFEIDGTSALARVTRERTLAADPLGTVRTGAPDDLARLAAYDQARFGGDRSPLLAMMLDDAANPLVIAERDGAMAGYAWMRPDTPRIGPILADDPSVAATLLGEAFRRMPGVVQLRLNLPPNNRAGAEWLRTAGAEIERWDGRMGRGPRIPRRDETIYGVAVGALG